MISVAVTGAAGRMGSRILRLLSEDKEFQIVGATEREDHPRVGWDAGQAAGIGNIGVRLSTVIEDAAASADGIIDFTTPEASLDVAQYAAETGKAVVIGTTGFSPEQVVLLRSLAEHFPCVYSPNMSVGVNVMFKVAGFLAKLLGEGYDIEVMEIHHRHKVDAPSGTALGLAEAVCSALSWDTTGVLRFERHGKVGERRSDEIGVQALRGGDVVGEHTVYFLGSGERIELTHRATSRDNFAAGALRALKWVVGKPPGLYSMKDVLGI
ncbi:MAG: 4-hydroxy-tetrahydrodipicolinate reductase [Candidatus Caldarchaeum sp.]